jgi:hypothetical protein
MDDYHPLSRSLLIFDPKAHQPNLEFRSYLSGDRNGSLHMLRTIRYYPFGTLKGEVSNLQIRRKCRFLAQNLVIQQSTGGCISRYVRPTSSRLCIMMCTWPWSVVARSSPAG